MIWLLVLLFLVACSPVDQAAEPNRAPTDTGQLTVSNVRANMTLPSGTGSVWLTIHNGTAEDDALLGGEIEICETVELHNMSMDDDIMEMRQVDGGIAVGAGESIELEQGGLHMMCVGKSASPQAGTSIDVTLNFAKAGRLIVAAEVVAPGSMNMEADE